ncbi:MAG: hypothetical protein P8Y23_04440 [Candidatus Lokiarchaeota archaeon]|jgi:hypothetical protein
MNKIQDSDYLDDFYLEDEIDDSISQHQKMDYFNAITELSRHLRSFLRYKEQVINYRFRSTFTLYTDHGTLKYTKDKNCLQEAATNFINILKEIKKKSSSIELEIYYLAKIPDNPLFRQLIIITNKLFILIHKFSEQDLRDHPHLLKLLVSSAREASALKKCLDLEVEEFFSELELGYEKLGEELDEMLSQLDHRETMPGKKQLEEKLGI